MAKWHVVIKTINGRRYRYRQTSWREAGRMRTRSEYLEPVDGRRQAPRHVRDATAGPSGRSAGTWGVIAGSGQDY